MQRDSDSLVRVDERVFAVLAEVEAAAAVLELFGKGRRGRDD